MVPRRHEAWRVNDRRRGSSTARGYGADWRLLRDAVLAAEPSCRRCAQNGRVEAAVLVDHIVPIEAAPERRLDPDNLQPLCRPCHAIKTAEDMAAWHVEGQVMDPRLLWPSGLPASALPLTVVAGPPAAGKSTLVAARAGAGDVVIDVDRIAQELGAGPRDVRSETLLAQVLARRNGMLIELSRTVATPGRAAWFIVGAPSPVERAKWARQLEPVETLVLATEAETCHQRIAADPARTAIQHQWVRRWWRRYQPWVGDREMVNI